MEIKTDYSVYQLSCACWSGAEDTLQKIMDNDLEDEFADLFYEVFGDEIPDLTEVNDWLRFEDEWIFEQLGIVDVDLPDEVTISASEDLNMDENEEYEEEEISDMISDYLTDTYDYCHNGFEWEKDGDKIMVSNIDWDTTYQKERYKL